MLLFGFECDVKNVSLSQIFLTEPMLVVVTVVFGQIVRVIRLVLRVSWCESQNASLQALFVCVYLDGGNVVSVHAALLRRRRKLWTFGIGNHVSLNHKPHKSPVKASFLQDLPDKLGEASENQTPYRSQNPHLHHQPAQFNRWDVLT